MTKISLIIPIYNAEKTLRRCLDSVTNQSFVDFECLLINDGSIDKSNEICNMYMKKDSRFKLYTQSNKGVSAARNLGIKNSQGEYICFLDSDDFVSKNYLKNLMLNISNCDLIISGVNNVNENGIITPRLQYENTQYNNLHTKLIKNMIKNNAIDFCYAKLFKKRIIDDNNITFSVCDSIGEDTLFVCQYLIQCKKIKFEDFIDYYYVNTEGSLSKINDSYIQRLEDVNDKIVSVLDNYFEGVSDSIEWEKRCWSVYYYCFFSTLNNTKYRFRDKWVNINKIVHNKRFRRLCKQKKLLMNNDNRKIQFLVSIKSTFLILLLWKILELKK